MQTTNDRLYTYDDYLKLDDANQYELIGGKLILVPAPRTIHQKVTRKSSVHLLIKTPLANYMAHLLMFC